MTLNILMVYRILHGGKTSPYNSLLTSLNSNYLLGDSSKCRNKQYKPLMTLNALMVYKKPTGW